MFLAGVFFVGQVFLSYHAFGVQTSEGLVSTCDDPNIAEELVDEPMLTAGTVNFSGQLQASGAVTIVGSSASHPLPPPGPFHASPTLAPTTNPQLFTTASPIVITPTVFTPYIVPVLVPTIVPIGINVDFIPSLLPPKSIEVAECDATTLMDSVEIMPDIDVSLELPTRLGDSDVDLDLTDLCIGDVVPDETLHVTGSVPFAGIVPASGSISIVGRF